MREIASHLAVPVKTEGEVGDNIHNVSGGDEHITIIEADLNNATSLRRAFVRTHATDIFLVTTTYVPVEFAAMGSFHESEEVEYESIKSFFDVLAEIHKNEWIIDGGVKLERHVILSAMDNVQGLVEWLEMHKASDNAVLDIKPLDDGGIASLFWQGTRR